MSWGLAAGWITVAGLLLLTVGTAAQAWANLSEYRDLFRTATRSVQKALWTGRLIAGIGAGVATSSLMLSFLLILEAFRGSRRLAAVRQAGGEEAVRLAQLLRLAGVWSILMAGSALILAAAVIQLALAYTG